MIPSYIKYFWAVAATRRREWWLIYYGQRKALLYFKHNFSRGPSNPLEQHNRSPMPDNSPWGQIKKLKNLIFISYNSGAFVDQVCKMNKLVFLCRSVPISVANGFFFAKLKLKYKVEETLVPMSIISHTKNHTRKKFANWGLAYHESINEITSNSIVNQSFYA